MNELQEFFEWTSDPQVSSKQVRKRMEELEEKGIIRKKIEPPSPKDLIFIYNCRAMKVIKLAIFIGIISIVFCLKSNFAYADGSSFAAKTPINTPQGKIVIEELSPGDRVVGYDFAKHQQTINQISSIKTNSSLSFYLINDRVKIAGTQFIYKKTSNNPEIVRVQQLKEGDFLLTQDRQDYLVAKIEQVVKPSKLYQIILENQANNLFADRLLIYNKDAIEPIIKKDYAYLDCDFSTGSYRCFKINSLPTKLVVLITFSLLILGMFLTDNLLKKKRRDIKGHDPK